MNMKKYIRTGVLLLSAFLLSGCTMRILPHEENKTDGMQAQVLANHGASLPRTLTLTFAVNGELVDASGQILTGDLSFSLFTVPDTPLLELTLISTVEPYSYTLTLPVFQENGQNYVPAEDLFKLTLLQKGMSPKDFALPEELSGRTIRLNAPDALRNAFGSSDGDLYAFLQKQPQDAFWVHPEGVMYRVPGKEYMQVLLSDFYVSGLPELLFVETSGLTNIWQGLLQSAQGNLLPKSIMKDGTYLEDQFSVAIHLGESEEGATRSDLRGVLSYRPQDVFLFSTENAVDFSAFQELLRSKGF